MRLSNSYIRISYLFLLVFLVGVFSTCKKYEEGPCISFKTKKSRLTGNWEPVVFLANEIDSLLFLKADTCYGFYSFLDNNDVNQKSQIIINDPFIICHEYGAWSFINQKEILRINFKDAARISILGPYGAKEDIDWKIERLTNEDLWLKVEYHGINYEVKFKKTKEL